MSRKKPDKTNTPTRATGDWKSRFIEAFRNSCNVRASCQAAGVNRSHVYDVRDNDPVFRAAWQEAKEDAVDTLDAVAWQRARDHSDWLLWKLLQAHRRDVYSDNYKIQHSGPDGGPIEVKADGFDHDAYTRLFHEALGHAAGAATGDGARESVDTADTDA